MQGAYWEILHRGTAEVIAGGPWDGQLQVRSGTWWCTLQLLPLSLYSCKSAVFLDA